MNYEKLTKAELLDICKEKGIAGNSKMKKADLIELLTKGEKKKPVPTSGKGRRISLRGKKTFRSDGDLTVNSEDKFNQAMTDEEKDDMELKLSEKNKIIQTGTIYHITEPREVNGIITAFAIVRKRVRKVLIPVQTLFDNYDEIVKECTDGNGEVDKKKLAGRFALFLRSRQGSEIDYIVQTYAEGDDGVKYLGSRVEAMAKKREDYWFSHQVERDENGNQKYRINVGDRPEGRIVSVTKNAVIVEIFGVECLIHAPEVDYAFIPDLRKPNGPYAPGMKEKVVITDIIRDNKERTVKIKGSIKMGKTDPMALHFDDYSINDWVLGKVTGYGEGENGIFFYVSTLEDSIPVVCYLNDGIDKIPERGDTVEFRVSGKDDEKLLIWGRIKHIY